MKSILKTEQAQNDNNSVGTGSISKNISLPIILGLAALIFLLAGGIYWQYAEDRKRQADMELAGAMKFYQYFADNYQATMGGIVELLAADDRLPELLAGRAGDELFLLYGEAFLKMQRASGLTYLIFADNDRRVITRIHQPDDRNDIIERASFVMAEQNEQIVTTLDAGSDGRLSLRMVAPVWSGNRLAGFIEAGMEMEGVLNAVAKPEKINIILALEKQHISQERINFDHPGDNTEEFFWSDSSSKYYLYTTFTGLNPAFTGALRKVFDENGFSGPNRHFDFSVDNNVYAVSSVPLSDSCGNRLGALFAVYNGNALRHQYITAALVFLAGLLVVAAIVRFVLAEQLRTAAAGIADMESALVEGEHLFESIYAESNTAFIIRISGSGTVLKANAAALAIFSVTRAKDIDIGLLVPASTEDGPERLRQTPLMTIHSAGKVRFFEMSSFVIGNREELECFAIHDVTDGILLGQEDRAHIEFLQNVINQLPGWVCIKDSSLRLTQTNDVFDAIFGQSDSLQGMIRHSEWLGDGMDKLLDADRVALLQGKPVTFELTIPSEQDARVYMVTKQRFTGRNGQIFILSSGNDITERAEMINQLVALNKKAEEVALLKTQFLARMSHEMRTPMNAVLGISHLALQETPGERVCDYLNKIREAAGSRLQLISNILDFSQLEAGEVRLENQCYNLTDILDEVETETRRLAAGKPVTVIMENSGAGGHFWGDPARISQVLHILCDNAVKFTNQGQVRLGCAVEADDAHKYCVRFTVEDTGIGISDEHLERLFDSFHQVDGGTTRKYGGTGLGLALARHILALMDSTLEVQSSLNRGSCFAFSLVLQRPDHHDECPLPEPALSQTGDIRQTGEDILASARILVVEDNDMNQEIIMEILSQANVSAIAVDNGQEAVDIVKEQMFDLILMDLQMPVMGGLEATKRIRELESGSVGMLPIIALTANALESDRANCAEAGMNDFMTKPVDVDELYQKLRLWLNVSSN